MFTYESLPQKSFVCSPPGKHWWKKQILEFNLPPFLINLDLVFLKQNDKNQHLNTCTKNVPYLVNYTTQSNLISLHKVSGLIALLKTNSTHAYWSVSLNTTLRSEMPLLGLKYHSHGQILPPVTKFMIGPGINQKPTDPE